MRGTNNPKATKTAKEASRQDFPNEQEFANSLTLTGEFADAARSLLYGSYAPRDDGTTSNIIDLINDLAEVVARYDEVDPIPKSNNLLLIFGYRAEKEKAGEEFVAKFPWEVPPPGAKKF